MRSATFKSFLWKCYKTSRIATNKKEFKTEIFALFHCCIGHYLRASWARLKFFFGGGEGGEKLKFLFFMVAKRLELIYSRKQIDTAPHLKFDTFHHNKRIAIFLGLWPTSVLSQVF